MEGKKKDTETIYICIMKDKIQGEGQVLGSRKTYTSYHSLRQPQHQTRQGKVRLLNVHIHQPNPILFKTPKNHNVSAYF